MGLSILAPSYKRDFFFLAGGKVGFLAQPGGFSLGLGGAGEMVWKC